MKKEYSDQYKHPNWQKKRLEILQRDDFTCIYCNDKELTLHIHHKIYIKGHKPWEYDNNNFITLCENCHKYITIIHKVIDYNNFKVAVMRKPDEQRKLVIYKTNKRLYITEYVNNELTTNITIKELGFEKIKNLFL